MNILVKASVLALGAAALAACDDSREAEADTPVSEAEVSTELPESVVSDDQLQATANAAADVAASPPAAVVPVPVPADGGATGNQAGAMETQSNQATGTAR